MPKSPPSLPPPFITSRRSMLAGAALVGLTTAASAQNGPGLDPSEGKKGGNMLGPHNAAREQQNPDILKPPETDNGSIPNLRFSFADALPTRFARAEKKPAGIAPDRLRCL